LTSGRWFEPADQVSEKKPIIINRIMQEELFGEENPLGKEVEYGDDIRKVVGIYEHYKYGGEFSESASQMFVGVSSDHVFRKVIMHIKPGTGAQFESKMLKEMGQLAKGVTLTVNYLDEMRSNMLLQVWLPMMIFLIISGFLIFNVALGLFGVLWQNINIRKGEIGVRRAVGATQVNIGWQFTGEVLVLSSLAMIVGTFFAIQFPLLGVFGLSPWVYLAAIGASIMVIYALVVICAFFPSRQASLLHPALALHEE
jgi:putative ABC transport system permease protein